MTGRPTRCAFCLPRRRPAKCCGVAPFHPTSSLSFTQPAVGALLSWFVIDDDHSPRCCISSSSSSSHRRQSSRRQRVVLRRYPVAKRRTCLHVDQPRRSTLYRRCRGVDVVAVQLPGGAPRRRRWCVLEAPQRVRPLWAPVRPSLLLVPHKAGPDSADGGRAWRWSKLLSRRTGHASRQSAKDKDADRISASRPAGVSGGGWATDCNPL